LRGGALEKLHRLSQNTGKQPQPCQALFAVQTLIEAVQSIMLLLAVDDEVSPKLELDIHSPRA